MFIVSPVIFLSLQMSLGSEGIKPPSELTMTKTRPGRTVRNRARRDLIINDDALEQCKVYSSRVSTVFSTMKPGQVLGPAVGVLLDGKHESHSFILYLNGKPGSHSYILYLDGKHVCYSFILYLDGSWLLLEYYGRNAIKKKMFNTRVDMSVEQHSRDFQI